MKKKSRLMCALMAVCLIASLVAGCGSSSTDASTPAVTTAATTTAPADTTAAKLEKVPLTIMIAGDRPKQQDEVIANLNKITEAEINMDLKINYIPWGDYENTVKLKATAGEEFDIFLSFFSSLAGNIARKQCIALNDLLDKYGADLKQQISQDLWDTLTVDGNIYGVPAVYAMTEMGRGFLVRKDLREKYGLPEITDQETYNRFLDTIATKEKGIIPNLGEGVYLPQDKSVIGHAIYRFGEAKLGYLYIDVDKTPFKVENYFKTELFKKEWQQNIEAMSKGWLEKDILNDMDRDGKFIAGKAASMGGDLYNINDRLNALKKNVPEAEIELAIINKEGRWVNLSPVNNFGMISSTSRNPERAVMFMNWLRKDQKNYDAYMLGIEGKTYVLKGDQAEVPEGTNPVDKFAPTPWFTMHFPYLRTWTTDSKAYIDALSFWTNLKPEANPIMTFSYTSENVKAEAAAVQKVVEEQGRPISCGLVTSQEAYDKFLADLDKAGMPAILEDTQKQLDEFMAKKNIK